MSILSRKKDLPGKWPLKCEILEHEISENENCGLRVWQVTAGFENLFVAHNTWFAYQSMMRIFKYYHLNVKDSATAATSLSFSSYPGLSFAFVTSTLLVVGLVSKVTRKPSRR